jgi:hypothetical protein
LLTPTATGTKIAALRRGLLLFILRSKDLVAAPSVTRLLRSDTTGHAGPVGDWARAGIDRAHHRPRLLDA